MPVETNYSSTGQGDQTSAIGNPGGSIQEAMEASRNRLSQAYSAMQERSNQVLTGVTNLLFGGRITDMETCYKVMEREVAQSLDLESNRFDIEPEITAKLLRAGHSILELPIRFEPRSRAQGKKIGWRDGVRAIQVLVKYRFSK